VVVRLPRKHFIKQQSFWRPIARDWLMFGGKLILALLAIVTGGLALGWDTELLKILSMVR
jgi:hypothetical protein